MMRISRYVFFMLCSLLLSCHGSDPEECSVAEQNRFVHELLLDVYLWYEEVLPSIDYASFSSPRQTLDFLLYHEKDRFSNITDAAAYQSLLNDGQYLGYGFSYFIEEDGLPRLRFVYHDSPAGRANLQRGDQIIAVNNRSAQEISAGLEWSSVFGPDEEGYPVTMMVRKKDASVSEVQMLKTVVNINTVLHTSIISDGVEDVGYLVFNSFLSTSDAELFNAFSEFKARGVRKLILDLRYNGGGSVWVANKLASYLYTNNSGSELFARLQHNDKHRGSDSLYYFQTLTNQLQLEELVIITTGSSCSASEMIINGLNPYVHVTTVGSTTCGKPVGMNGYPFCDKLMLPITFAVYNSEGEGEYFDGIAAQCAAEDDLSFEFGNEQEPMLSEALFVSRNQRCRALAARKPEIQLAPFASEGYLRRIIGAY